jgi:acyl-CoA dehydrogenase
MTDRLLIESVERAFADVCTFQAVQAAEERGWAADVWAVVGAMGLPWISVPETAGGSGGSLCDALSVVQVAGRYAAPIPLAETGVLAGWLLAGADLPVGDGPSTVVPGRPGDTLAKSGSVLCGVAHRVPWARVCERVVALVGNDDPHQRDGRWLVVSVPVTAAHVEPAANLAGEPRDSITFDRVANFDVAAAAPGVDPMALMARGALSRVALIAGALERMSELTIEYTSQRKQFAKPVASFQAVQAHLVHAAQHAALVSLAAQAAAREANSRDARFEIAAAKVLAGRAASLATGHAHQAHGAIGMTQEYALHHLSRRLWSWRDEFGDERFWSIKLGAALERAGADLLYPAITAGSLVVADV